MQRDLTGEWGNRRGRQEGNKIYKTIIFLNLFADKANIKKLLKLQRKISKCPVNVTDNAEVQTNVEEN